MHKLARAKKKRAQGVEQVCNSMENWHAYVCHKSLISLKLSFQLSLISYFPEKSPVLTNFKQLS